MESRWRIQLLGELRAEQEGRVLPRFQRQKAGALLAYLAYYLHRSHLRDTLIELLWPDADLPAARHSLSQTLFLLRQQLEPPGTPAGAVLLSDRTSVRLNPDVLTTDVAEFEAALQSAAQATSAINNVKTPARIIMVLG